MEKQFGDQQPWFRFRTTVVLVLAGGGLIFSGCNQKPAVQTTQPVAAVPTAAGAPADMGAMLDQLTQALRKYSFEHRHVPASFSELAATGIPVPIPPAPAGKKFAIDAKAMRVVLVNQ